MSENKGGSVVENFTTEKGAVIHTLNGNVILGDRYPQRNYPNIDPQISCTAPYAESVWPQVVLEQVFGRADDMVRGRSVLLGTVPCLALRGLPGVGKTTLALALAKDSEVKKRFPNVLWGGLVRKETRLNSGKYTNNIDSVLMSWACAVGVGERPLQRCRDRADQAKLIFHAIGDRSYLIVIDDVWDAGTAKTLISVAGPNCGFIVTTRQEGLSYEVPAAENREVQCLNFQYSLELLRKEIGRFDIDSHMARVQQLVERAAGLPLALKLIGPFLRSLDAASDTEVSSAVARYIHLSESEDGAMPTSFDEDDPAVSSTKTGRTGRSTAANERLGVVGLSAADLALNRLQGYINASVCVLSEEAQTVLGALCRFAAKPNTFSLEAARYIANQDRDDHVNELRDAGLLEFAGKQRFALHQVVVDYGKRVRSPQKLRNESRARFVDYHVDLIKRLGNDFEKLAVDYCNVLEAMRFARDDGREPSLVQGMNSLSPYVLARGLYHSDEMNMLFELAERHSDYGSPKVLARLTRAIIYEKDGNYNDCESKLGAALDEALCNRGVPRDAGLIAHIHLTFAILEFSRSNYVKADLALERAIEAVKDLDPPDHDLISHAYQRRVAVTLCNGCIEPEERAQRAANYLLLCQAATQKIQPPDPERQSGAHLSEGLRFLDAGDLDRARASFNAGLKVADTNNQVERSAAIRHLLIAVECACPQFDRDAAEQLVKTAEESATALGHRWYLSAVCCEKGQVFLRSGEAGLALKAFESALQQSPRESHDRQAFALRGISRAHHVLGDFKASVEFAQKSFEIFSRLKHSMEAKAQIWLVAALMDLAESQFRSKELRLAAATFSKAKILADAKRIDQAAFANFGLARIAFLSGDSAQGNELTNTCIEQFRGHPDREKFIANLSELGATIDTAEHSQRNINRIAVMEEIVEVESGNCKPAATVSGFTGVG